MSDRWDAEDQAQDADYRIQFDQLQFERMKARVAQEQAQKAAYERQALEAEERAKTLAYGQRPWAAQPVGRAPWQILPLPPDVPSLQEGVPPIALASQYLDRAFGDIMENERRQKLLAEDRRLMNEVDSQRAAQEAARLALGKALSDAVTCGLITEDRAVDMVMAGRINDQPLGADVARRLVRSMVAQALAAQAISIRQAERALEALEMDVPTLTRANPSTIQTWDVPTLDLMAERMRWEELVYQAITVRPCHDSEHDEIHRTADMLCQGQLRGIGLALVLALGVPTGALPREAHCESGGARSRCCQRDNRVGTWLVWGKTIADTVAAPRNEAVG